jgi:hypothetical protein
MPRTGKGTRNRQKMAELATVKAVNARYSTHETAARIERAVLRATGERIPSRAVFSAMGIRPVEGMASRGQWLTQRAMSESVSTGAPDDREFPRGTAHTVASVEPASKAGTATLRNRAIPQITVATLRRELRNATRRLTEAELLIAKWEIDDSIIFLAIFIGMQDRYLATGDYQAFIREVDQLDLAREASGYWAQHMLSDVRAGQATADRVRAAIDALRRNDVRNGRAPLKVADCKLWESHTPEPVKVTRAAPVAVFTAPVEDHAQEIMHANPYFTRGDA